MAGEREESSARSHCHDVCPVAPYHNVRCPVAPYHNICCPVAPYHNVHYPVAPYHNVHCPVAPYHNVRYVPEYYRFLLHYCAVRCGLR